MSDFVPLWLPRAQDLFEAMPVARTPPDFEADGRWSGPAPAPKAPAPRVEAAAEEPPPAPMSAPEPPDEGLEALMAEAVEAGRTEGLAQARAEVDAAMELIEDLAGELAALRSRFFERAVADAARAVKDVAAAVVQRELAVSSEGIEVLLRSILDSVAGDDEVVIHLAPRDDAELRDHYPRLLESLGRHASFRIEVDAALTPGGTMVETAYGRIDGRVETRFQAFAERVDAWAQATVGPWDV